MGEVWEAEQTEPVRRRVALKLVKLGLDSAEVIARFESERQALALMNHPAIAKVFDAGATEQGRPFFVMELVRGIPITEYCDRRRMTIPQRLALFLQVCEGVQHAHQMGIIHRDIKPANILIADHDTKPAPKIIDFGVAKALVHRLTERTLFTELGQVIGTPEYMSPEQAEIVGEDVDVRADVYSLGMVLYELLVGALPFSPKELRQAGMAELKRKIREDEPTKPSTQVTRLRELSPQAAVKRRTSVPGLLRNLRGDLDWIILKALEKDPGRRYYSASDLAADISCHLQQRPVAARAPSTVMRTAKFVRRHPAGVALSLISTFLVLVLALAGAIILRQERRIQDLVNQMTPQQQALILRDMQLRGEELSRIESIVGDRESADRATVQKPVEVLAALGLHPGERVADVGAGTGYFTIPIAKIIGPTGRIWAADIDETILDFIARRVEAEGLENVSLALVASDDPGLPARGVDTIILVDTYRYLENRTEYAKKLRNALAPGGRVVIIDGRPGLKSTIAQDGNMVARAQVDAEMAAAGLVPIRAYDFLPEQYFVVYRVD